METIVKAYVGNLEVIGDGNVHISDDKPLILLIDDLEMEFKFIEDSTNKSYNTSYKVEGKKWIWELVNYNNSLGTGVLLPISVGTLNRRKLFVSFYSWRPSMDSDRRIINYVVYLEKEA